MVDAAVRPSETPTAEPHIDAELVTRMLLGTWADTRREAREMIKDPAFWQINGQAWDINDKSCAERPIATLKKDGHYIF